MRSLLAFVIAFFTCWTWSSEIYQFLAQPIYQFLPTGTKLAFLGITDPFMVYMKVAALAAVFAASPVIPPPAVGLRSAGLYPATNGGWPARFIFFGSVLFLGGGAFAYYVAFPMAVEFLLKMGADFAPTLTVDSYLSFLMTVILGLGLMFELPTVIFFLSRLGLVTPGLPDAALPLGGARHLRAGGGDHPDPRRREHVYLRFANSRSLPGRRGRSALFGAPARVPPAGS